MIAPCITTYSNGDANADAWLCLGLDFNDPEKGKIRCFQLVSTKTGKAVALANYKGTEMYRKETAPSAPEAVHFEAFLTDCERYAATETIFEPEAVPA
jgi:hypothetical protein